MSRASRLSATGRWGPILVVSFAFGLTAGCGGPTTGGGSAPVLDRTPDLTPDPIPARVTRDEPRVIPFEPKASWDTEADRGLAQFIQRSAGDMVAEISVGVQQKGRMQVVLGRAVEPDDTLPLTKSIVAGARKDFPDKPFTLTVFDPSKAPILKAHVDPVHGVKYELASAERNGTPPVASTPRTASSSDPAPQSGLDQRFQDWAMAKGHNFLRYVEADLSKSGRIWFGITREVAPKDVPDLTKALLEGAHTEFPRRKLVATVFDPQGERIGRATLELDGSIQWQH